MKQVFILALVCAIFSCKRVRTNQKAEPSESNPVAIYSKEVNDSFRISISLPEEYNERQHYPVLYLVDANFNFDIMQAIAHTYVRVGMLPPLIIAGIGYKDLEQMEQLRDRDFTYPEAAAKDSFA